MRTDERAAAKLRATIFDVARHAGVSIKTVSRVVNNEPNVREATRDKVRASIDALHYRPNAAARGLSAKRSFVIGLIYENSEEFSYTKDLLSGVLGACETHNYSLLLRPLTLPSAEVSRSIQSFIRLTAAEGVVLPAPIGDMPEVMQVLSGLDVPVATISPKHPRNADISVYCDEADATFRLTEHVLALGHTRIGFIKGHPDHRASHERLAGFTQALQTNKIGLDASLTEDGRFTFESGRQAAFRLLRRERPPTAIIATNDEMACGVMHAAHELDLHIPHDVSIAGFDDTAVASRLWPPLTTVRQPITEMAEAATSRLIQRLIGDEPEAPEACSPGLFPCQLVIRRSTAARS